MGTPDTSTTKNVDIVHNLDISVPSDVQALYPDLSALLQSSFVEDEFNASELRANSAKKWFNLLGSISLVLIISVLLFTTWKFAALSVGIPMNETLTWLAGILSVISLVTAGTSRLLNLQSNWLYSRFVTERLRQFKFQQLLDGPLVALSKVNPQEFNEEMRKRLAGLEFGFTYKSGAMNDFIDAEDFNLFVNPGVCSDEIVSKQIYGCYLQLRLDYQAKYFKLKRESLVTIDEWTNSLAKFSLIAGGMLAVLDLAFVVFSHNDTIRYGWALGAAAVSAGLLSAGIRVIRSANAISEEVERYSSKWVVLKILKERFQSKNVTHEDRLQIMIETERVCIEELREFLRAFKKSDFWL